ncbi:hypothetical protein TNCV_2798991 [Trichonephila clavipes]|nr:hypothetical protein TNCV_2798991 [Trichonephila clavipes]
MIRKIQPAVWHSWFVVGLLHLSLRARIRPKSVDCHDAENRKRSCRMIMRHVKYHLNTCVGLGALGKIKLLKQVRIIRIQVLPSGEKPFRQIPYGNWHDLYGAALKCDARSWRMDKVCKG